MDQGAYGDNYSSNYLPRRDHPGAVDARAEVPNLSGLVWRPYTSRYYPEQGIAPHGGLRRAHFKEDLAAYQRKGYSLGDRVGKSGWNCGAKAGWPERKPSTCTSPGSRARRSASWLQPGQPADSIYTTLDANLQEEAQKAISGFTGAVVLERDSGRAGNGSSASTRITATREPELFLRAGEISSAHGTLVNCAANGGGYPPARCSRSAWPPR
jgi:hypothetical protein